MRIAKVLTIVLLVAGAEGAQGPAESPAARELTGLLRQFLDDAGKGNRAGFERFFADDVIYTRSTGIVVNKSEILANVGNLKPAAESKTTYSAEDIAVHSYTGTAVVTFRLVARTEHNDGKVETAHYRNTGTFLRRTGRWQVVAWQATKIQEPPESIPPCGMTQMTQTEISASGPLPAASGR